MKTKNLSTVHFFIAYLACLLTSSLFGMFVEGKITGIGIGLLVAFIALLSSSPFIILFLLLIHFRLKKENTLSGLHGFVFLIHTVGALLTLLGFYIFSSSGVDFGWVMYIIIGYYALDTLYFHLLIQLKFKTKYEVDLDTLDSFEKDKEIEF